MNEVGNPHVIIREWGLFLPCPLTGFSMRNPNQIPSGVLSLQPETHCLDGTFFSRKGISNFSLLSRDALPNL